MKFDHKVKYNGKWYMPGEEIGGAGKSAPDFSQFMNLPEDPECELPFVTAPKGKKHTKTEINRMPASELKTLAKSYDVENAEDMTGGELKKALIEKLGL